MTLIIACIDGRIDPQRMLGTDTDNIFVARNVANLVPTYEPNGEYHGTSAAIEFAVQVRNVEHIIVLGHAQCGGIRALLQDHAEDTSDFVLPWMRMAGEARQKAIEESKATQRPAQLLCEHESIKLSLRNLMTFPWIREKVETQLLGLHGWYFDIAQRKLMALDERGAFHALSAE
jgi:carbonic anhydrase